MTNALRATALALSIYFGTTGSAPAQFSQQQLGTEKELRSVRTFLNQCNGNRTVCTFYLWGVMDGVMVTEAIARTPYSYCTRGASYVEITDSYLSYINAEQLGGNYGIVSEMNLVVFKNFMDARYHC
jgi:hypothetical protein